MTKRLEDYTREELIDTIKSLKSRKKFGLVWEDKPEQVAEDCKKKLPVLSEETDFFIQHGDSNAPNHIIIEGDNYHALSVLNYTHTGRIDCIYIDPPYNTGARDWKYNNDYVDINDVYRHSKWLSMMEKRLRLCRKLLRPDNSVLICTIDEKEYARLGCLLEEVFPEAHIQMISSAINQGGVARKGEFYRVDEYIYYVFLGDASPTPLPLSDEWLGAVSKTTRKTLRWRGLMRAGSHAHRTDSPKLFYPIFVSEDGKKIVDVGLSPRIDEGRDDTLTIPGCRTIWPIRSDGADGTWQCSQKELLRRYEAGYVRLGNFTKTGMGISYLAQGEVDKVEKGLFPIIGHREDGSIITDESDYEASFVPGTQWRIASHNAGNYGSTMLNNILCSKRFTFPKSVYAVADTLRFVVANNPNAIILDFFAGSGTTLHAVNLLNANDGGQRTCIMATNNEVSADEERQLTKKGFVRGDEKWEELGIARHVTYPRSRCTIEGHNINGEPLQGIYFNSDILMAEGFNANVRYFKTGFVDKNDTLDRLRRELSPACEDMIRIREGAFEKVIDEDMLKVFKNSRGLTAVIYDRFDLDNYIEKIEALETDAPVHLYVFSYDKGERGDQIPKTAKHTYESQPIPEGVLEVYKRIFR